MNDNEKAIPKDDELPAPQVGTTTVLRRIGQSILIIAVFAGVLVAASAGPSAADWREECIGEGCSGEEKEELFESFHHECVAEGCWAEEVGELAGAGLDSGGNVVSSPQFFQMMNYFQARSSYDAWQVDVRPGRTDTFFNGLWREIVAFFDGRVIGFGCDYDIESSYVGNCGL